MKKNETDLLQEAYLSITNKMKKPEPETTTVGTEPNPVVDVGPMDEPAPGIDMNMTSGSPEGTSSIDKDTTGTPVSMSPVASDMSCGCEDVPCSCNTDVDLEQEDEEDQMTIDNLNSVRESIVKIASYCAGGGHLETWAQQKLAIAMDNLAEVARRLH
jgi:hypothetical protein